VSAQLAYSLAARHLGRHAVLFAAWVNRIAIFLKKGNTLQG